MGNNNSANNVANAFKVVAECYNSVSKFHDSLMKELENNNFQLVHEKGIKKKPPFLWQSNWDNNFTSEHIAEHFAWVFEKIKDPTEKNQSLKEPVQYVIELIFYDELKNNYGKMFITKLFGLAGDWSDDQIGYFSILKEKNSKMNEPKSVEINLINQLNNEAEYELKKACYIAINLFDLDGEAKIDKLIFGSIKELDEFRD